MLITNFFYLLTDEPFPWHSTLSRTRQLFPVEVFKKSFERVLQMCIDKGMVSGHTQSIDSALVKANASMDSLELKVPAEKLDEHLCKVRIMNKADRKPKKDKSEGLLFLKKHALNGLL
ncbi:MAG: hypothetical protein JW798_08240 [Prolixibacteraceae bacterium]|nr:hypothetical protein [Prolixibacteraceae bacterium]